MHESISAIRECLLLGCICSSLNDAVVHAAGAVCWWCTICSLTMSEWTAGQNVYASTLGIHAARMSSLVWKSTSELIPL